jgi:ribosomal protein S14
MDRTLLNKCKTKIRCLIGGHDWGYFLDANICRVCTRCRLPEYDLPWAPTPRSRGDRLATLATLGMVNAPRGDLG